MKREPPFGGADSPSDEDASKLRVGGTVRLEGLSSTTNTTTLTMNTYERKIL